MRQRTVAALFWLAVPGISAVLLLTGAFSFLLSSESPTTIELLGSAVMFVVAACMISISSTTIERLLE